MQGSYPERFPSNSWELLLVAYKAKIQSFKKFDHQKIWSIFKGFHDETINFQE